MTLFMRRGSQVRGRASFRQQDETPDEARGGGVRPLACISNRSGQSLRCLRIILFPFSETPKIVRLIHTNFLCARPLGARDTWSPVSLSLSLSIFLSLALSLFLSLSLAVTGKVMLSIHSQNSPKRPRVPRARSRRARVFMYRCPPLV